ncbi:hypothetical protein [Caldovatus aquaticus]|uniref:DUF1772 domain-containing protein n=1 Tax=Caldovatus aquaticus TaxID=2865671 RepID=A0ABS7F081_9PROT|nr:hypothetical protein [Caldovatus aquaticus]MBW8268738.1 hypothetical protein [Caldovatus aquaticus]
MALKTLQFLAIVLTALGLVPAGAHLFALPNKIGLAQEAYFVVQGIYRGWALFGLVLVPALFANLLLAFATRRTVRPSALALMAAVLMAANLAIFLAWTCPANAATENWTNPVPGWEMPRTRWEYSHAANAVLTFGALCLAVLSVLAAAPWRGQQGTDGSR